MMFGIAPQSRKFCAAKSPPRREQRYGFEKIGLARPIGSGQGDEPWRGFKPQGRIVAIIGQRQSGDVAGDDMG